MNASTVRGKVRAARTDPVLVNSSLIFITTTMMAAGGAVFWVVAARLQSPEVVGVAGSLVSASDSLALFAQLGLNITLLQVLPKSQRRAADIATAALIVVSAGMVMALGYALLTPITSERIHEVLDSPLAVVLFAVLVAGCALNMLTDQIFLSINKIWSFLRLNGVFLGLAKCTLPFVLAGGGALGLYGSVGGATLACALISIVVIFRHVPGSRRPNPSPQLRGAKRFAGAGYLTYVLNVVPQMVLPLMVINALGSANAAVFFISVQIVTLQNSIVFAVGNSMYSEAEKSPHQRRDVVRRGGITLLVLAAGSVVVMVVMAPYFLKIFGPHYAAEGTATLRMLSLSTLAVAFNFWAAVRLRIVQHLRAMIIVQLTCTALILGLAGVLAPMGTVWVASAWGIGQLIGGVVGLVVSLVVAPLRDEPLTDLADPSPAGRVEGER